MYDGKAKFSAASTPVFSVSHDPSEINMLIWCSRNIWFFFFFYHCWKQFSPFTSFSHRHSHCQFWLQFYHVGNHWM